MSYDTNYEIAFVQKQLSNVWPNWRISRKLGKGSYGNVYEIERDDLGARYTCALKVLHMETDTASAYEDADYTVSIQNAPGHGRYGQTGVSGIPGGQSPDLQGSYNNSTDPVAKRTIWDSSSGPSAMQAPPTSLLIDRISEGDIEEFLQGVSSEIDLMMQLKGVPNIVTIEDYAVLRSPGRCTILIRMEELEPLDSYLARKGRSLNKQELIRIGTDICNALAACEQKNILHRDIKTSNLFYSEEAGFKLGDFGISRTMASIREKSSMSGIGTLRYMAPEVYQGRKYNNTADIYSLGIVLYVLANDLIPPFYKVEPGQTPTSLSTALLHEANMRRLNGEPLPGPRHADQMLSSVICTACDPVPESRFQTAEAFRNALLSCLYNSPARETAASKAPAPDKKRTIVYVLAAVAAVLVLFLAGAVMGGRNRGESETDTAQEESVTEEAETDNTMVVEAAAEEGEDTISENQDAAEQSGPVLVEWSDYNLRDAVQASLGFTGDLTADDAAAVQKLDLTDCGISDISSLRYFTGLTELILADNSVSDLSPLAELYTLKKLNLEKNLVSDVTPLAGLAQLERLDLYENSIEDISALSGLVNLTMLDIRANDIGNISALTEMTRMTNLYMSENRNLADLTPLSNMPDLFYLSFKQTSVSNIDALRNAVNMDTLVLSQTGVRDISVVDRMTKLTYLDIRDCPIKDYGPAKRFDARDNSKLEK